MDKKYTKKGFKN